MGITLKDKYVEEWLKYTTVSKFVVWICILGISTKVFTYWYSRRHLRDLANSLPGPTPLPILGDALSFSGNIPQSFNILLKRIDLYGTPCRIWIGPKLYVVLTDPGDIATILGHNNMLSRDSYMCKIAEPLMGQGLITSKGEVWRTHRKIITPTFNSSVIQQFIVEFNNKTRSLVERLALEADGSTISIFPFVATCTLDMICSTAMGAPNTSPSGGQTYIQTIERAVQIVQERFLKPWLFIDWIYRLSNLHRDQTDALNLLNKFTDDIILQRINGRSKKKYCEIDDDGKRNIVLLDLLISASESEGFMFTPKELRDEVNTLIAAGHETSSTSICYALLLLAMYPKAQDKVIQEQKKIFGDDFNRDVTYIDMSQMSYLDCVIRETLRMFPPAPIIHREIEQEVKLRNFTLVPGCSVLIVNYKTHRLPEHYDRPDLFDPDRFLDDKIKNRHPYAYIPFGSGPRNCVGRNYALMQMKTVLSTLLRRFRVSSRLGWEDLAGLEYGIVLKPACGFNIELFPREGELVRYCS